MPRVAASLTASRVAQLIREGKPAKVADGACSGLTLKVTGKNQASWVLRFTSPEGQRKDMGLGAAAMPGTAGGVGLSEARELAEQHRRTLRTGADPLEAKRQRRAAGEAIERAESTATTPTFRKVAEDFIAGREAGWTNTKHGAQWTATLRTYAFPTMGNRPVDTITTEHVLAALQPVWTKTPETGARLRQRIEAVLDAAKALGHRQGENPARWKGHLAQLLPKRSKVGTVEHHPSLPWPQIPAFLAVLEGKGGTGAPILRFLILTACRSGEARGAVWSEIDMEAAVWTIPAQRMKGGKIHRVPLSPLALDLLRSRHLAARTEHGHGGVARDALVFPSRGAGGLHRPTSDMTLSMLLRGMSYDGLPDGAPPRWRDEDGRAVVPHGFRSTFKSWSLSQGWGDHLSEKALAHSDPNAVRKAYAREDLLEERRPIMLAWSEVGAGRSGISAPIGAARHVA